jgi:rRNA-processing protein FCF1
VRLHGITVDTGFLVAVERSKRRALALLVAAGARKMRMTVPVAVLAEWWRAGHGQGHYLQAFEIEPMSERLAKSAGEAIAAVHGATVVDAIVMASAAQRDDVVYTSDFDDLSRLREQHFRGVRVLGV